MKDKKANQIVKDLISKLRVGNDVNPTKLFEGIINDTLYDNDLKEENNYIIDAQQNCITVFAFILYNFPHAFDKMSYPCMFATVEDYFKHSTTKAYKERIRCLKRLKGESYTEDEFQVVLNGIREKGIERRSDQVQSQKSQDAVSMRNDCGEPSYNDDDAVNVDYVDEADELMSNTEKIKNNWVK